MNQPPRYIHFHSDPEHGARLDLLPGPLDTKEQRYPVSMESVARLANQLTGILYSQINADRLEKDLRQAKRTGANK